MDTSVRIVALRDGLAFLRRELRTGAYYEVDPRPEGAVLAGRR